MCKETECFGKELGADFHELEFDDLMHESLYVYEYPESNNVLEGFDVPMEPFDAMFDDIQPIHFNEAYDVDSDIDLNSRLRAMAMINNDRMVELHNANIIKLKEDYIHRVYDAFGRIRRDLSLNVGSKYGDKLVNIEKQLRKEYRISIRDEAARQAEKRYIERYESKYSKGLADIALDTTSSADEVNEKRSHVEASWQQRLDNIKKEAGDIAEKAHTDRLGLDLCNLYAVRNREARALFDSAVNNIMDELSKYYTKLRSEEKKLFDVLSDQMMQFVIDYIEAKKDGDKNV